MKFRAFVDTVQGLRFLLEELPLSSGASWRYLLDDSIPEEEEAITERYCRLDYFLQFDGMRHQLLTKHLSCVHDISNTLFHLQKCKILDDIELYEIKHLSYVSIKIAETLPDYNICDISISQKAFDILDPYKNRQDSFYIYDIYDEQLAKFRKDNDIDAALREEQKVLSQLSERLRPLATGLMAILNALFIIDVTQAKAVLFRKYHFTHPVFKKENRLKVRGMFNPYVRTKVGEQAYQSIDICLHKGVPAFLIGMNMGGKTVTLNTLVLLQLLAQTGFGCPAEEIETEVCPLICGFSADNIEKNDGYSSFANELFALDEMIKKTDKASKAGCTSLIVIDEPARTTNPTEGAALVQGLVDTLRNSEVFLMVATHYNVHTEQCAFLRVKGLTKEGIDYHIEEVGTAEVPNEAIAVAELINVSEQWINNSKHYLPNAQQGWY